MVAFIFTAEDDQSNKEFMVYLYVEFERLLFYTAGKYVSKPEVVEDIVQESLVKLHEKIETIRPMSHIILAAYIRSTVRNTAINVLREMGHEKEHIADVKDLPDDLEFPLELETVIELANYRELLSKIWPRLSNEDQILLEGKYILGYNDHELAQAIGCKANSIRMKLTRARRHALKILTEQEGVKHFDEA